MLDALLQIDGGALARMKQDRAVVPRWRRNEPRPAHDRRLDDRTVVREGVGVAHLRSAELRERNENACRDKNQQQTLQPRLKRAGYGTRITRSSVPVGTDRARVSSSSRGWYGSDQIHCPLRS